MSKLREMPCFWASPSSRSVARSTSKPDIAVATLSLTPTLAEKTFSGGTESFNQSMENGSSNSHHYIQATQYFNESICAYRDSIRRQKG